MKYSTGLINLTGERHLSNDKMFIQQLINAAVLVRYYLVRLSYLSSPDFWYASFMKKKERALKTIEILKSSFPQAECSLYFNNPFQLMVATILSAQCTDDRVNQVTPKLFKTFPDARAFASANIEDIETLIRSTGFFRNKARSIQKASQQLLTHHHGEVPQTIEELVTLGGVGRKTANVVLGNAFGQAAGVVVDTHVKRITRLLKLTRETTPEKIEQDLNKIIPQQDWVIFPHLLINHGRKTCKARKPLCSDCELNQICPSASS